MLANLIMEKIPASNQSNVASVGSFFNHCFLRSKNQSPTPTVGDLTRYQFYSGLQALY